jgi:hypothetical protein
MERGRGPASVGVRRALSGLDHPPECRLRDVVEINVSATLMRRQAIACRL